MILGIVSEPKSYTRKYFFKRLFNVRCFEEITNPHNPFDINVEILPLSKKYLKKMSAHKLEKLIKKRVLSFKKHNISTLVLSNFLYNLCRLKGIDTSAFANGKGKHLFLSLMPLCLRETAKKAGIDLYSANVCIRDTKMDRISEYLLRELCFDTKNICLITQNLKKALAFCESFYDETGLWVDVTDTLKKHFDAVLDVDKCQIKIGYDLFVRGAEFEFDFCGYEVCHLDTASILTSFIPKNISWIYAY